MVLSLLLTFLFHECKKSEDIKKEKTEYVFCLIKKTEEVFVAKFTMQND
jgi:hypothetical protein